MCFVCPSAREPRTRFHTVVFIERGVSLGQRDTLVLKIVGREVDTGYERRRLFSRGAHVALP